MGYHFGSGYVAQQICDANLDAQMARDSVKDEVDKACRQWKIRDARLQELLRKTEKLLSSIDLSGYQSWNDWLFRRDLLLREIADLLGKPDCVS